MKNDRKKQLLELSEKKFINKKGMEKFEQSSEKYQIIES
jgi:hypothetical protein